MPTEPAVIVALPAYNERENLAPLVERWMQTPPGRSGRLRFVIVDDGSTDGTAERLAELAATHPIEILIHEQNCGLGVTIRDALIAAVARAGEGDVIVTMDADNTQPPELIEPMLALLERASLDVVIASRYRAGAEVVGLSALRRLTSLGARLLFQAVYPVRGVRDYTCGYRLYRAEVLTRALATWGPRFCAERGFTCMAEILLQLAKIGARFGEVGMVLRYDAKAGASKMRVWSTMRRTVGLLLRYRVLRAPKQIVAVRRLSP